MAYIIVITYLATQKSRTKNFLNVSQTSINVLLFDIDRLAKSNPVIRDMLCILRDGNISYTSLRYCVHTDTSQTNQKKHLRLLTKCFILVGYAMFGATFILVTRVGPPFLEH